MKLTTISIEKALSKAYLKQDISREQINTFKRNMQVLFGRAEVAEAKKEHEEHYKNIVSDFLKDTYYKDSYEINISQRMDLVIHNGRSSSDTVGVIAEAKKPSNVAEMISPKTPNAKALHELLHYYMQERFINGNKDIKHLVATDCYQWYIFDAGHFEEFFFKHKSFVARYEDWHRGSHGVDTTDWFYKEFAKPLFENELSELEAVYFNLLDYKTVITNADPADDIQLVSLYKILSPEHLLKRPFANDSNTLNRDFYNELLYIMGLEEQTEGGKKLIGRIQKDRQDGSLLENAINIISSYGMLKKVENREQFGATEEEQLYSVGLELCIMWLNRILFLKLLEGQLIKYHGGNTDYAFINEHKIADFDELDELFFEVLAVRTSERSKTVASKYGTIPYLNSSLFESSNLESQTIYISKLKDRLTMPVYKHSVLHQSGQYLNSEPHSTLHYLFQFLAAYNFSSDSSAAIQEQNKTIINASVLGLIFEKINGYKDGSFFTPGFITMYMCRETIRRAVAQKFAELEQQDIATFEDVKVYCRRHYRPEDVARFNSHINSLRICDPAVGSGHFLVSALNELIAIKSELGILYDAEGMPLGYDVAVDNDELVITSQRTNLPFEYLLGADGRPPRAAQLVQAALFEEKHRIIESCLFGVDINPKSVLICRLRLWIELLKNAYYIVDGASATELQTLPNIDINIKCGNSLISRFALDADLKQALKKSAGKWTIDDYRIAVSTYRNAENKEQKWAMERLINDIKTNFRSEIANNDPMLKRLSLLRGELFALSNQTSLFEQSKKEKDEWNKKVARLAADTSKLETEIEDVKSNKIYDNAFEWRFEFPEVLDDNGAFIGFDVVVGNPPYIRQEEFSPIKNYLQSHFTTYAGTADLYVYFVERAMQVARQNGHFAYILPNKWMKAGYGAALRKWVDAYTIDSIIDFGDLPVFEEATTYPCVWQMQKKDAQTKSFTSANVTTLNYPTGIHDYLRSVRFTVNQQLLSDSGWTLVSDRTQHLLTKIKTAGIPLGEYVDGKIYYGIKTGLNEAFVIDGATREQLIAEHASSAELIKPFLAGRDIKRYQQPQSDSYLILIPKGFTIKTNKYNNIVNEPRPHYGDMPYDPAWDWFRANYPAIARHLLPHKQKAEARSDKGDFWWELRACDYYGEFEKEKIIIPAIANKANYCFDTNGNFSNDKTAIIPLNDLSLLALLNSKLLDFLLKMIASTKNGGYFEYKPVYVSQLPIAPIDPATNLRLQEKVKIIMSLRKDNADTTALEAEIDQLVYQLYGLTEEEIAVVEGR